MTEEFALLETKDLTKAFGGVLAVNGLSFQIGRGRLKAIIGPNGAGKTTLFNLITGVYKSTGGSISFKSKSITGLKPYEIAYKGIARTFQIPKLFPDMTVLENVMVGCHCRTRAEMLRAALPLRETKAEESRIHDDAMHWLKYFGIEKRALSPAETIPFGERRVLEIARALTAAPELLLLDEPAAGLNDAERGNLGQRLLEIAAKGTTILWVEHHMRMVMSIADEVMVMDWGKMICEGTPTQVLADDTVIKAYLGAVSA